MGLSQEEIVVRGKEALESLGILNLKDRAPYRLSGGQKRKVSIACVLSIRPEIILFYEPISDLYHKSRKVVIGIIKNLADQGKTVIVATHDVNAVPDFATHIIVCEGRLSLAGASVRSFLTRAFWLKPIWKYQR